MRLLPLLAEGKSNPEIADELGLAVHSVENYVSELMDLWGCADRGKLIVAERTWGAEPSG
jgi:DNA-binding NarL/FixJ family response regulator